MPIPIITQQKDPLFIEYQFKWTNKLGHTALDESSVDEKRCIPWKCRYLCQPFYHSINLLNNKCHISTWVLGYAILSKVLEELLERIYDNITHIKNLIKSNLELGYPPLIKPTQSLILIFHYFNKSRIRRFYKELLFPLITNNVFIFIAILIGIHM